MLWNKILLIYDGSENSLRAVEYLAKMFGQTEGIQVTILGVHEKVPRHDFKDTSPIVGKLQRQITSMEMEVERGQVRVQEAKTLLAKAGVDDAAISVKYVERKQSAVKEIISEAEEGGYGTLILARGEATGVLAGGSLAKDLVVQAKDRVVCVV